MKTICFISSPYLNRMVFVQIFTADTVQIVPLHSGLPAVSVSTDGSNRPLIPNRSVSMDLKALHYFVTIADEGAITTAAKKLHISQPPLSRQLHLLEEELGQLLFERGPRQLRLTAAGRLLYKRACHILELSQLAKKEMSDYGRGQIGILSLGTVSSSGSAVFQQRMQTFCRQYPQVRFELREGNTFELLELLFAGIIEVAIVRTPFKDAGLGCIYLEEEPMVAVASADYHWPTTEGALFISQLRDRPLIFYRRFETLLLGCCEDAGFEPDILCKNDDARTTLLWATTGAGVSIMPRSALQLMGRLPVSFKVLKERSLYTRIAAVWVKDRYLSSVAQRFLEQYTPSASH